jgi:hypothetical protein
VLIARIECSTMCADDFVPEGVQGSGINTELKSVLEETRTSARRSSRMFADLRLVAATFGNPGDPSRVFWLALPTGGRWRSFIVFDFLEGARIFTLLTYCYPHGHKGGVSAM